MTDDLIHDLEVAARTSDMSRRPETAKLLRKAREEILRCHERLEIAHVWNGKRERIPVPYSERHGLPDGIECRDSTIELLEESRGKRLNS